MFALIKGNRLTISIGVAGYLYTYTRITDIQLTGPYRGTGITIGYYLTNLKDT